MSGYAKGSYKGWSMDNLIGKIAPSALQNVSSHAPLVTVCVLTVSLLSLTTKPTSNICARVTLILTLLACKMSFKEMAIAYIHMIVLHFASSLLSLSLQPT